MTAVNLAPSLSLNLILTPKIRHPKRHLDDSRSAPRHKPALQISRLRERP